MARKASSGRGEVGDYRHKGAKRKNNPPAGLAPTYARDEGGKTKYQYDPHLDPQLVWAGKAEHTSFDVDVVSLHIHERVSTRAILEAVKKPVPQMDLFGNGELPADQQIEFYQHDVGWANRLILGDSLLVMNSMLVKEGMAGKVQCIYIDPPYGIKYASNMQSRIDRRDVKDTDDDLTHEPEQIKAYRDTWKLGIHSYLTYLRDRLWLAKDLLHQSGSLFVQINEENVPLVRDLADEVFGRENFVSQVVFQRSSGFETKYISGLYDVVLWFARGKSQVKYRPVFVEKYTGLETYYDRVELPDGTVVPLGDLDGDVPQGARYLFYQPIISSGEAEATSYKFEHVGHVYSSGANRHWKTSSEGMVRLAQAGRLYASENTLKFVRYHADYPAVEVSNIWSDTVGLIAKDYVVQTNTKVVDRCMMMTTDPGDLVFDPTCGSGTTAFCAEKWGRRWVTCDTSRVALQIARQRLMTAKYDYFEMQDSERGPVAGFKYETVPHITLESIAKNPEIDAIAAKHQPQIDEALKDLNKALKGVTLSTKSVTLSAAKGLGRKRDSSAAPQNDTNGGKWQEWEVPREVDKAWDKDAKAAHKVFWGAKQAKRREIDASIQRNAPQETLYDRPFKKSGVVRVTGPFTVEAIPAPAVGDPSQATPVPQFEAQEAQGRVNDKAGDYLSDMMNLLKQQGGVLFPKGKKLELANIRPLNVGFLHAEAEAPSPKNGQSPSPLPSPVQGRGRENGTGRGGGNGKTRRVAISFGSQYGPVIAMQVDEAIRTARANTYDILLVAGFSFEAEAQLRLQKAKEIVRGLDIQFANIAPDVLVGDLLKTSRASQIFTGFGQPDIAVVPVTLSEAKGLGRRRDSSAAPQNDTYRVKLKGVDIYDPLTGESNSASGEDVAAWFLDCDYDGMTFHICQAFFPGDKDAWEKLQRALKAQIEPETFEQMRGTESFPFEPGKHKRIAVKVIDFRGNEVMGVRELGGATTTRER